MREKTGIELPPWWPQHADGTPMTHLYRVIDEMHGWDLCFPDFGAMKFLKSETAMSDKFEDGKPVDFTDDDIKTAVMTHIDQMSEGQAHMLPFLSTTQNLESAVMFRTSAEEHYKDRHDCSPSEIRPVIVRLDLIVMFLDGVFTENSFADLSNSTKFAAYFKHLEHRMADSGCSYNSCMDGSNRLK